MRSGSTIAPIRRWCAALVRGRARLRDAEAAPAALDAGRRAFRDVSYIADEAAYAPV